MKFDERVKTVLSQEADEPERWMYLSFADEQFKGAVITKASGIASALLFCNVMQINPGGEVMAHDLPDEVIALVPEDFRNRLLSKDDVLKIFPDAKSLRELKRRGSVMTHRGRSRRPFYAFAGFAQKLPVQNSRAESVPAPDDRVPLSGEAAKRMQFFLAASKLANSSEFLGLVALSLCASVDTETWEEAVCDALETLETKR